MTPARHVSTVRTLLRQHPDPTLRRTAPVLAAVPGPIAITVIAMVRGYAGYRLRKVDLPAPALLALWDCVNDGMSGLPYAREHATTYTHLLRLAAVHLYPDEEAWWDLALAPTHELADRAGPVTTGYR